MATHFKAGLKKGSTGAGINDLQSYLRNFGYLGEGGTAEHFGLRTISDPEGLTPTQPAAKAGDFDDTLETALRSFQRLNRVPETGVLDEPTANLMNRPRCGIPDVGTAFSAGGQKWPTTNLRYSFQNFTADLTSGQIVAAIEQAFALWAAETPLRFSRVAISAGPEIIIRFVTGDHGDGSPFDGPSGVLAHAFFPPTPPAPLQPSREIPTSMTPRLGR